MKTTYRAVALQLTLGLAVSGAGGLALAQEVLFSIQGATPSSRFGADVARVGDMDGDGISEFAVGAPLAGGPGTVTLHRGSDGLELWAWSGLAGDRTGESVCGLGDISGDGQSDVAVGRPFADAGGPDSGSVVVLSGADGSLLYTLLGSAAGDEFGTQVACVGDMDGDGISEFCVGLPGATGPTGDDVGAVKLFRGSDGAELLVVTGDGPGDRFGQSLARVTGATASSAGVDLNGDATPDFVVGAQQPLGPGYVRAVSGQGGATLYTVSGSAIGDDFGRSLCAVGDMDGDGISEIAVGWPGNDTRVRDGGALALLSGSDGALIYTRYGSRAGDFFGHACGRISDYDGDGISEIMVGAPGSNGGGADDAGGVVIRSGFSGAMLLRVQGSAGGQTGSCVTALGDVDGDGIEDFLVSSPGADRVVCYSPRPVPPTTASRSGRSTTPLSNPWKQSWGNNGSGWIGGWNLGSDSRFLSGHFIFNHPTEQLLSLAPVVGPGDYAKLLVYSAGNWPNPWGNNGSGSIGFFGMTSTDVYLAGNFDASTSQDELLCLNPVGAGSCAKLQGYSGNTNSWWPLWDNACSGSLGTWNLGPGGNYVVSNFDGLPGDELLCIGLPFAKLFKYDPVGVQWVQLWGNGGDGKIFNGLALDLVDRYVGGDWNATNLHPNTLGAVDELMLITEAHATFGFSTSSAWNGNPTGNLAWSGNGAGTLSGLWTVNQSDHYIVGNLVQGGGDELMTVAPGGTLSHLYTNSGANFQIEWSSFSSPAPWNLGYPTTYLAGDFVAGNGKDELLTLKAGDLYAKLWYYQN